jgi:drug/metabolite transporter (DMT)-like permease
MKTEHLKPILLLHIVLLGYSLGGIFSKLAAKEPFLSKPFIAYYGMVLFILFLYAVLWQQILKKLPLVVAYVNKAVTVVWGLVWGYVFFQENITLRKVIASMIIIAGIICITTEQEDET